MPRSFTDLDIMSGRVGGTEPFTRAMRSLGGMDADFVADTIAPGRRGMPDADDFLTGLGIDLNVLRGRMDGTAFATRNLNRRIMEARGSMLRARNAFRGFGRTLLERRPSIMTWWNVLALIIPIMITLAGAAVGLIAAFSGVAVAAAGIVGIGLLGWGDDMQESFQNLRKEAKMMGAELFDVLRPVSTQFQPILQGAMGAFPQQVARLRDELMNLSSFAPGLGEIGRGFIDWVESSLQLINEWQDEIVHIALVAGRAFGSFIQDFLVFGLRELIRNQEAYEKLGRIFVDFFRILFEVSKAAAFVVAQFEPLFGVARAIAKLLSNRFTVALLTFLSVAFLAGLVTTELAAAMAGVTVTGFAQSILTAAASLKSLIISAYEAITALRGVQFALAATGLGLGLVLAGTAAAHVLQQTRPEGRLRGGRPTTNNIVIQGDVGRREMQQFKDYFGPEFNSNVNARNARTGST